MENDGNGYIMVDTLVLVMLMIGTVATLKMTLI
jgi:hypothetical protein